MKIKSILAGIAAAGTVCAVSAAAFADDAPMLISPNPNADDIMVISTAPQKSAVDEILEIYGGDFDASFLSVKAQIAAVGGADVYFEMAKQFFSSISPEEVYKMLSDTLKAQGLTDEEIKEALASFDSATEFVFNEEEFEQFRSHLRMIEKCGTSDEFVEYIKSNLEDEYAAGILAAVKEMGGSTDSVVPIKDDITAGGDNADTGAEGVAAVVGVIAVAGAVVVISRKKA